MAKMKPFAFVLERDSEPCFAVVSGQTDRGMSLEALNQIRNAITAWVKTTEGGAALWKETNGDMNIGDVGGGNYHTDDADLIQLLQRHGIYDLSIEIHFSNERVMGFGYDGVLPREEEIEKPGD